MKTERIYLRVTPELKSKLQDLANAENRTISNYIELLIKKELERKGTE